MRPAVSLNNSTLFSVHVQWKMLHHRHMTTKGSVLFFLSLNMLGMYFCHSLDIDMSHMSSVRPALDQKHLAGALACH